MEKDVGRCLIIASCLMGALMMPPLASALAEQTDAPEAGPTKIKVETVASGLENPLIR